MPQTVGGGGAASPHLRLCGPLGQRRVHVHVQRVPQRRRRHARGVADAHQAEPLGREPLHQRVHGGVGGGGRQHAQAAARGEGDDGSDLRDA